MKYRKKPVVVEAIQFNGSPENFYEIGKFTDGAAEIINDQLFIQTLEGEMHVSSGDYLIKGIKGEFYPCKPDIFEMTYEKV